VRPKNTVGTLHATSLRDFMSPLWNPRPEGRGYTSYALLTAED